MIGTLLYHSLWISLKFGLFSAVVLTVGCYIMVRVICKQRRACQNHERSIGFFHPYCNAGGGGERVLWEAIRTLQDVYPTCHYVVYTGDIPATPDEILGRVKKNLKIELPKPVEFVYLHRRHWVEASRYPHFTLLGQSLGSLILGWEALMKFTPHIFIDTMGYAFTVPLFKYLGQCRVASYVHYPTISTDMLRMVSAGQENFNNDPSISSSRTLTISKLIYYKIFAFLYSMVGRVNDVIMVNSSWTKNHIDSLWARESKTFRIFPPCDTREFSSMPLTGRCNETIISVGQFRPEKNHELQIKAFAHFRSRLRNEEQRSKARLVLIGGCRDRQDELRVEKLRNLAADLGVAKSVLFKTNIPFDELQAEMSRAGMAVHCMYNEHFGIGIVEGMAAGLITVANNSGGPKLDIIQDGLSGFLASSVQDYSDAFYNIAINMTDEERHRLRVAGREAAERFSTHRFQVAFTQCMSLIVE